MRPRARPAIMLSMNRPLTASRLMLVADRSVTAPELRSAPLRRYRLARVRLEGRPAARDGSFKRARD